MTAPSTVPSINMSFFITDWFTMFTHTPRISDKTWERMQETYLFLFW
jgi:hypothetical protein